MGGVRGVRSRAECVQKTKESFYKLYFSSRIRKQLNETVRSIYERQGKKTFLEKFVSTDSAFSFRIDSPRFELISEPALIECFATSTVVTYPLLYSFELVAIFVRPAFA